MQVTVRDVARACGVSTATVSRALNGSPRVRPEVARAILLKCEELGFRRNGLARGLTKGSTSTIGLLVANIDSPFYTYALRGMEAVASAAGYTVILSNSNRDRDREVGFLSMLEEQRVAGLVTTTGPETDDELLALAARGTPSVVLTRRLDRRAPSIHSVRLNNLAGGREATRHLIDLGRRRIGVAVGSLALSTQRDRLAGHRRALAAADLPVDAALTVACRSTTAEVGYEAVLSLLRRSPPPEAILVTTGLLALGAYRALREVGARVPDDVALVGFDDFEWAPYLDPPLTTMAQPAYEMGAAAASLLLEELARPVGRSKDLCFEPTLIVRRSCGAVTQARGGGVAGE